MGKVGRNQLCPCGSGRKVKRCCAVRRAPSDEALARAFLAVQLREALPVIVGCDRVEVVEAVGDMLDLPERDLSLLVALPRILTPELDRLARVVREDEDDEIDDAMEAALPQVDTPLVRARLARAVIALRDMGRIDERVAAMALVQLAGRSVNLLRLSLLRAVAVVAGAVETPSGILVASR